MSKKEFHFHLITCLCTIYNVTDAKITNKWVNTVWADLRSHHFKNPAIFVSVNSDVCILTLISIASAITASTVHSKLDYCNSLYYSVSQKTPPYGFLKFFPKRLGIFNQFLHTYYTIISTLEYKLLFKYLQL